MSLKLGHKVFLLTAIPLVFLLGAIGLIAFAQRNTASAVALADHSRLVLAQTSALMQTMLDAEDNKRGYVITGSSQYSSRCKADMSAVPQEFGSLEKMVSDNPGQERAAHSLDAVATTRLALMRSTLALAESGRLGRSAALARFETESAPMNAFRRQMIAFINEETRLQAIRNDALHHSFDVLNILLVTSAVSALALTLLLIAVFSRGTVRRISVLGDKAERFAQGNALGDPAPPGIDDEIARADRAFHAMADVVAQRQGILTRYQLLAEHARDIILFVRRRDAHIIEANGAAVQAYGYSRAELLQMTAADLRVPEERQTLAKHLESSDHGPIFFESTHLRKDGSSFPVEVTGQGGHIDGERVLLSIVRDVSDRKKVEAERDRVFNMSIDMMCVANFDGYFVRLNPAWERTLGFTRDELMSVPSFEYMHPGDRDASAAALHVLTEGLAVEGFENRYRRKDGEYRWFAWSAIPALDDGLIYAVARDVTERREKDAELERSRDRANEASRIKSEFLANMSHEIRTPMNGIIATIGLLSSMALTQEQSEYVDIIKESGEALLAIINQILDLSKLEAGKVLLDEVEFSPLKMVESVSMLFASAARQKGLSIQGYVDPDVPSALRGDAGQLRQVLINLTGNAVKFTDSGGIVLRVDQQSSSVAGVVLRIAVSDTGIGLTGEALERLFEPFTQADSSTTRRYGGSGLGLSISKRIVELFGGEIGVERNQDRGTTFWFTIPLRRCSAERSKLAAPFFAGVRVLVVDPDTVSRDVLHQYLFNWGMRNGVTASTIREALTLLRSAAAAGDPYDLAFIDGGLVRGDELIQGIADDRRLAATKLILLNPIAVTSSQESPRPAGFSYFLSRPIRQSYLFDCIAAALHRSADGPEPVSEKPPPAAAVGDSPAANGRVRKILVAEDNEINRRVASAQFKRLGVDADFVRNGREAVDAVAAGGYDVIFMDCQMPEMDGFEATREIRKAELQSGAHIPIIAMTANAMEGDRETCVARGMDDYLSKPVDFDGLRATLDRWVTGDAHPSAGGGDVLKQSGAGRMSPPMDLSRLRQFFGDDDAALDELLRVTVENTGSILARLQRALDAHDAESARHAAHELKGFAANVGAETVATLAAQVESRITTMSWDKAQVESTELSVAIDHMVDFAIKNINAAANRGERP
ncbi:MAG TPA: PAS domain S-box protein [Candidatus Eremiobacteraceae bacterium]|nr:PAS domain S-box protein [Candidatus Eremiobacteraceae bacterium]